MKEMKFLMPDQIARLSAAIDPRYRGFVLLGAWCGLRAGELLALTPKNVDLDNNRLEVAQTLTDVQGHLAVGPPKTRAGRRTVPIPRAVSEELAGDWSKSLRGSTDPLLAAPAGGYTRRTTFRKRVWLPAIARAELDPLRMHDLRHTAVSLWIAAGISPKAIADRAGHRSVATVLDRYGHLLDLGPTPADSELDRLATASLT